MLPPQGTRRLELAPPSGELTYDPAVVFDNLMISPAGWSYLIQFELTTPDDTSVRLRTVAGERGRWDGSQRQRASGSFLQGFLYRFCFPQSV